MADMLRDKICLVTGGSTGIGRSAALTMAGEGATVVIGDVDVERGNETVSLVEQEGCEALMVPCNVAETSEVEALVGQTFEKFGRIDCAFNNAGIEGAIGPLADLEEADWDRTINVNLKGIFLCMKHEIRAMLVQGKGAIVNTASVAGLVGAGTMPAYAASKHGVVGVTKSAALVYASAGVRINAVCPAVIETEMKDRSVAATPKIEPLIRAQHPIGRFGQPQEVAEAVVWLLSDAASFVTGHALAVDGGFVAQ